MLVKLDGTHHSKVKIGNGDYIDVKGIGDIAIDSDSGVKIISDMLYVPEIDINMLSVGQLLEKDFVVVFKDKTCEIFDTNDIKILSVRMKGKSLPANMQTDLAYPSVADHGQLWHKRLGHYHYSALSFIQKNDLVQNMPSIEVRDNVCGVCELGKQSRKPFPHNQVLRVESKLQLVHTDVYGPMNTKSINGSWYFILFIDDFSRFCWVYFMKQKFEVPDIFGIFKKLVENQCGKKIKVIISDNDTEYTSGKFEELCVDTGIEHQFTTVYTPQQNSVSERKNRTIMEMARCMLYEKKLPKQLLTEAINTATYLLNRLPTRALKIKTPFEAWKG